MIVAYALDFGRLETPSRVLDDHDEQQFRKLVVRLRAAQRRTDQRVFGMGGFSAIWRDGEGPFALFARNGAITVFTAGGKSTVYDDAFGMTGFLRRCFEREVGVPESATSEYRPVAPGLRCALRE